MYISIHSLHVLFKTENLSIYLITSIVLMDSCLPGCFVTHDHQVQSQQGHFERIIGNKCILFPDMNKATSI